MLSSGQKFACYRVTRSYKSHICESNGCKSAPLALRIRLYFCKIYSPSHASYLALLPLAVINTDSAAPLPYFKLHQACPTKYMAQTKFERFKLQQVLGNLDGSPKLRVADLPVEFFSALIVRV